MVIIFLDIDGVLLSLETSMNIYDQFKSHGYEVIKNERLKHFDPTALAHLHRLIAMIESSGLEVGIVISSDWRHERSIHELSDLFCHFDFSRRILDKTTDKANKGDIDVYRGKRIERWLETHDQVDINHYIVIDDNLFDIEIYHNEHFVHCAEGVFSERNFENAISILNQGLQVNLMQVNPSINPASIQRIVHPVILAAQLGHLDKIDQLITEDHLLLDYQDTCGQSILFWATKNHHLHVVNFLISRGANLNIAPKITPHYECPPLFWAIKLGFSDIAEALILAGATLDAPFRSLKVGYNQGLQPIHLAAREGMVVILKLLLEKKRELVDALDDMGQTPLIHAAMNGHLSAVKYLIDAGAHIHRVTTSFNSSTHGRSALYWAICNQHADIAQLLLKHDGEIHLVWAQARRIKDFGIIPKLCYCFDDKLFLELFDRINSDAEGVSFFIKGCYLIYNSNLLRQDLMTALINQAIEKGFCQTARSLFKLGAIHRRNISIYQYTFQFVSQRISQADNSIDLINMLNNLFKIEKESPVLIEVNTIKEKLNSYRWQGRDVSKTWFTLINCAKMRLLEIARCPTHQPPSNDDEIRRFLNHPTSRFTSIFFKSTNALREYEQLMLSSSIVYSSGTKQTD